MDVLTNNVANGYYLCVDLFVVFFFFKQKTAYEIVSRDWSSDVCSSDLTRKTFYTCNHIFCRTALLCDPRANNNLEHIVRQNL